MPMTCPPAQIYDVCPDEAACLEQLLQLRPQGRAWPREDPGQLGFWTVVAKGLAYINARICALALEFFCKTATETLDQWEADYGLPDNCDPFPDLCSKVAAQGGAQCDYWVERAAVAGWVVDCITAPNACSARAGCARFSVTAAAVAASASQPRFGRFRFGQRLGCTILTQARSDRVSHAHFGAFGTCTLLFVVHTASSRAYAPPSSLIARCGKFRFGQRLGCGDPDISGLDCLMQRITPAHATLKYIVL